MQIRYGTATISSLVVLLGTTLAQATPLAPGGTVAPTTVAVPAGVPLLLNNAGDTQGGLNEGFSWKTIGPSGASTLGATGHFINAVYRDPVTGYLDFYYQVQNTFKKSGTNSQNTLISSFHLTAWDNIMITAVAQLQRATIGPFFGDGANVEFLGSTQDSITSVSRSSGTGGNITINLASALKPDQKTSVLLLRTTATEFDLGSATFSWVGAPPSCSVAPSPGNLTPCGVADFPTFGLGALEPVVPEPGFYGLLALGIAGLWIGVHRRSAKAQA